MQNSLFPFVTCRVLHAVSRNFHFTGFTHKTHYEVLKVSQKCSNKDIKDSFIKLSKKFHPDINKNPNNHSEFVKLNEAYSILSRPDKRREYDLSLQVLKPRTAGAGTPQYEHEVPNDPWKDPSFYRNRDKSKDEENRAKPYYGIGILGRVSNSFLVAFLVILTAVGISLQALAIRHSTTFRRSSLDEASARHSTLHLALQEQAQGAGNKKNLQMIHSRLGGTSAEFSLLLKDEKPREEQQKEQESEAH